MATASRRANNRINEPRMGPWNVATGGAQAMRSEPERNPWRWAGNRILPRRGSGIGQVDVQPIISGNRSFAPAGAR